jgi:cellulose synthase/poly-beta-1,6-N-acetylglucosamine synthase-like glycosyltransferase
MIFTLIATLPYILVPTAMALVDFITVSRSRHAKKHIHNENTSTEGDFSVLVPIFGNMSYLKNIDFLKQYGDKVVLCTTTKENDQFNEEIERVARENNFRIFRSEVPLASNVSKPTPWRLLSGTFTETTNRVNKEMVRDEIIKDSFSAVASEYCIFIDGDTIAKESFYKLVGLMKEKNFDIASVRVLVSQTNTVMEKLQGLEYELAMDARKIYPWLTSGAGVIARTAAIKDIMGHHSLFFSGGDIEIGKLAGLLKYKVGHLHFEFYTDVPSSFKAWFKQRMAWAGGGFRHAIINFHSYTWRHPFFYFYTTILVYAGTPLRWYEFITHYHILPLVILIYWILIFTFHWKKRGWYFFLFPFYALLQVMIILPLGVYTYFKMALHSDNVGLIKLRYDFE